MQLNETKIIEQFNRNRTVVDTTFSDLSVQSIDQWVNEKFIEIDPEFQRRDRWDDKRRSQLIESFLLNIPVPPVYLSSEDMGAYQVIDGKQRITAIHRFMNNKYKLSGMRVLTELNGLKYEDMPVPIKQKLAIQPAVRVVIVKSNKQLDNGTGTASHEVSVNPDDLKYEVFHRLNTGGIKLEPQEIRNAIYNGAFNTFLIELSKNRYLTKQLGWKKGSAQVQQMKDVETILRFFYYHENWNTATDFSSSALDNFMAEKRFVSEAEAKDLRDIFETAVVRVEQLFGEVAFHKYLGKKNGKENWHASPNLALFDAVMIPLADITEAEFDGCIKNKESIHRRYVELFDCEKFSSAFVGSTGDAPKVKCRITEVAKILK